MPKNYMIDNANFNEKSVSVSVFGKGTFYSYCEEDTTCERLIAKEFWLPQFRSFSKSINSDL